MQPQDYSIMKHLEKTPAQISVWAILISSQLHRQTLMKDLDDIYMPVGTNSDNMAAMAMNTRKNNARRVGEKNVNEEVPSQAPQNPQFSNEEGVMSNVEIRSAIHNLTQVLTTQVSRDARVQVNPNASTTTSRIRDFTRMNLPTFFGSKVEEDAQGFIDEMFKVLEAMGVSSQEKVELAAYQLKDVAQVWLAMLIPSIDISRLMVHVEQIEEQKLKQVGRELKRSRADDGNSSKVRFEIQDKPKFKKRYSNQGPPNTPRVNKGKCLVGTGNCYECGKSGHIRRDCPMLKAQGRENPQAQASGPNLDAPKKNRFYALQSRGDQESSPNVVTNKPFFDFYPGG
ncbi:uncharacterized protein LOC125834788 [Solanum verrucosum]|uniref:uncharacterized protein LOC125834788 n=1 Tax=Solanum verrucosum TaxID=315347 RepID=UPI0020D0A1AA|nr:uncharacterized protein LOC125834788 [Solanum verrucosum]